MNYNGNSDTTLQTPSMFNPNIFEHNVNMLNIERATYTLCQLQHGPILMTTTNVCDVVNQVSCIKKNSL